MTSSGSTVRAVLLDVDGTLYRQSLLRGLMAVELACLPFVEFSWGKAWRTIKILRAFRCVRERLRQVATGEQLLGRLQIDETVRQTRFPREEVEHAVRTWIFQRPLKYMRHCRRRGVDAVLSRLAKSGIRIGVFSDYPSEDKLRALGLSDLVSLTLCATDKEINMFKPHPRGFLRACELWGIRPSEVLYVGDRWDVDVAGAEAAGMPCIILTSGAWLHRQRTRGAGRCFTITSFEGLEDVIHAHC